jgi:dihydrofolate reductase
MDIGGATLAAAAMRAGLIDEYAIVTHPVLVGGGTPFFTALDDWVNLSLLETRTFPDGVVLTRYETRRRVPAVGSARTAQHLTQHQLDRRKPRQHLGNRRLEV